MSSIPILEDLDMNYSEILRGRLQNVASLPTGLGSTHKGYAVYYIGKVWVWDGTKWNTWNNQGWTYEDNAIDSSNPRTETTIFNATSHFLSISELNINLAAGYDDGLPRTLGMMHFIGSDQTLSDWQVINGRRLVYTAKDGSWFNIKNRSEETVPSNHKPIDTRTNTDLFGIVKAEFSYNNISLPGYPPYFWVLISFERKHTIWLKRFDIPSTALSTNSTFLGTIPASGSEGLPYNGYYQVDVFVQVAEFTETMSPMYTGISQSLEISAPGDAWMTIDLSGNYDPGIAGSTKWFNNSLQGSAIVLVSSSNCETRKISWRVTLPNGTFKQIVGGYAHVRFLDTTEGNVCTS